MSAPPANTKRWVSFSLRTLLLFVVLIGAVLGWLGYRWKRASDRREAMITIASLDGFVVSEDGRMFGSPQTAQDTGDIDAIDPCRKVIIIYLGSHWKPARNSDLGCLMRFPEVESLDLYGRRIDKEGLVHLAELPKLRRLTLQETSVTPAALSEYGNLSELELLRLGGSTVTDSTLEGIANLEGLEIVQITDAPNFTDDGLRNIARVPRLRVLHVFRTPIDGTGLAHLRSLTSLVELRLNGTRVSNDAIQYLGCLTELNLLEIRNTLIDDDGARKIAQLLPDCQVLH